MKRALIAVALLLLAVGAKAQVIETDTFVVDVAASVPAYDPTAFLQGATFPITSWDGQPSDNTVHFDAGTYDQVYQTLRPSNKAIISLADTTLTCTTSRQFTRTGTSSETVIVLFSCVDTFNVAWAGSMTFHQQVVRYNSCGGRGSRPCAVWKLVAMAESGVINED